MDFQLFRQEMALSYLNLLFHRIPRDLNHLEGWVWQVGGATGIVQTSIRSRSGVGIWLLLLAVARNST